MINLVYVDPESMMNMEYGGRTAWNSHNKRDNSSPDKYVAKLVAMKHESVIEHGYCILEIEYDAHPFLELLVLKSLNTEFDDENQCKNINFTGSTPIVKSIDNKAYIRFNFRALKAFIRNIEVQFEKFDIDYNFMLILNQLPVGAFADMNGYTEVVAWGKAINKALKSAQAKCDTIGYIDDLFISVTRKLFNDSDWLYNAYIGSSTAEEFKAKIFARETTYKDMMLKEIKFRYDIENEDMITNVCGTIINLYFSRAPYNLMIIGKPLRDMTYSQDYMESTYEQSYVVGNGKIFYFHHDLNKLNNDIAHFCGKYNIPVSNAMALFGFTMSFVMPNHISEQLIRHRVFSFTKQSGRYIDGNLMKKYYYPESFRKGMVGHDKTFELGRGLRVTLEQYYDLTNLMYNLMNDSVAKEEARVVTPYAQEREIVVSGTCIMWKHWMTLRCDKATQGYHSRFAHTMAHFLGKGNQTKQMLEDITVKPEMTFGEGI